MLEFLIVTVLAERLLDYSDKIVSMVFTNIASLLVTSYLLNLCLQARLLFTAFHSFPVA